MTDYLDKILSQKNYLIATAFLIAFFLIVFSATGIFPLSTTDFLIVGGIVFLAALYRPGWIFALSITTLPMENVVMFSQGVSIRPYQLLMLATIIAMIVRSIDKRSIFMIANPRWIGGIVVGSLIALINSGNRELSLKITLILISFAAIYAITRLYIKSWNDLRRVIPFALMGGVVVTLYGIVQNWRFMHGLSSLEVMPGRPNSTFVEPDWLGMYLVFFLAMIYAMLYKISNFKVNTSNEISKYIACYMLHVASIVTLILTVSRSAWLGAGFVTLAYLKIVLTEAKFNPKLWQWKKFFRELGMAVVSIVVSTGLISVLNLTNFQLAARAQSTASGMQKITIACIQPVIGSNWGVPTDILSLDELEKYGCWHIKLEDIEKEKDAGNMVLEIYRPDPNVDIRGKIYQTSWNEIKKHPITGIGWGSIGEVLGVDERGAGLNSSNIFLEVWLGSGLLGLVSFLFIWVWIIYQSARKLMHSEDLTKRSILVFILLGAIAIIIPNLFNAGIFLGFVWVYLAIAESLLGNATD